MALMSVATMWKAIMAVVTMLPVVLVAEKVINEDYFSRSEAALQDSLHDAEETVAATEACADSIRDLFHGPLAFSIHHNGDPESCGIAPLDLQALQSALATMDTCQDMNKFELESFLTRFFAQALPHNACSPADNKQGGFLSFCDMGESRTPILLDHGDLVRVPEGSLPCRFHTREGVRIVSLEQLVDLARNAQKCSSAEVETCQERADLNLYAVPAGRVFMFAPLYVGEIFELPHVETTLGLPVSLEVLSLSPRVFDIFNFFSKAESEDLVERALAETSETHRIKRSTTGQDKGIFSRRTSENGFDTKGETAVRVKQRCLRVLGFDEYIEGHTDGLQILRYNKTTAYTSHMDYMNHAPKDRHDYDSAHKGGNRYATILLYMSDLEEGDGGETVFPSAWPLGQAEEDNVPLEQAIKELRASGDADALKPNSWEERMAAECRTRLAIRPNAARAVLFYSQYPDGRKDPDSRHGGCPVLSGEKWAANLWVWNTPRSGFEGSPVKAGFANEEPAKQSKAIFKNSGTDPTFKEAELYWDKAKFWGKLGHGDPPLTANTFEGHKWDVKVNGEFVKTWVIGSEAEQTFTL